MRFNVHGDLASGVGSSANAKWLMGESAGPIHPDFALDGGEWLDADTILSRYNAITRLVISTRASGWMPQDFAPVANEFRAGGGNWAATLQVGEYSTFGSHRGQPLPARVSTRAGVIDAARDGSLLFQDFDSHVLVLWADGRLQDLGVAAPYPSLTESGVFMATAGGVVIVRSNGDVLTCHLVNTAGLHKGLVCGDWIAYGADGIGRVLHRYDDPTQGYRLRAGWSPDMLMLGGQLHAAVSLGPAELPWELLREAPITLGQGMVSLVPVPPKPEPPKPEPPEPEPPEPEPPEPEPPEPEPPEPEEPDVTAKSINLLLRRDAETQTYLGFEDNRTDVSATRTDPTDARTWLEVNIYDQPGVDQPGKFAVGNKVVLRSREDQVCIYPAPAPGVSPSVEDLRLPTRADKGKQLGSHKPPQPTPTLPQPPAVVRPVHADLSLAGMFDLRAGEFPNTVRLGLPATDLAVYVNEDGSVEIKAIGSEGTMPSRFDFRPFQIDEKTKQVTELTIPF